MPDLPTRLPRLMAFAASAAFAVLRSQVLARRTRATTSRPTGPTLRIMPTGTTRPITVMATAPIAMAMARFASCRGCSQRQTGRPACGTIRGRHLASSPALQVAPTRPQLGVGGTACSGPACARYLPLLDAEWGGRCNFPRPVSPSARALLAALDCDVTQRSGKGDEHALSFIDCRRRHLRAHASRFLRTGRCRHAADAQGLLKPHHPRRRRGEPRSSESPRS